MSDELGTELARRRLMPFAIGIDSEYQDAWHHRLIAEKLEDLEKRKIRHLMITMPPRHGKSRIVSELFPAWYMGRNPTHNVIFTSYNQEIAGDFGRKVRNLIADPMYRNIFPGIEVSDDSASTKRFHTSRGGAYFAVGAGGSLTGRGGNCFPRGTRVLTEIGEIDISDLVTMAIKPRVLSYNHTTRQTEWKRIEAVRELYSEEITEIETSSGRSLQCTGAHPVYIEGSGYRPASLLHEGDGLLTAVFEVRQKVFNVRSDEGRQRPALFSLLQQNPFGTGFAFLRKLLGDLPSEALRIRESIASETKRLLLRPKVFENAPRGEEHPEASLHRLWSAKGKRQKSLFSGVLHRISGKARREVSTCAEKLRLVFRIFSAAHVNEPALQSGVLEQGPLASDARSGEFEISWGRKLRKMLCRDASNDSSSRRAQVRRMLGEGDFFEGSLERESDTQEQPSHSSHRRKSNEQPPREFDYSLPKVPHEAPQVAPDAVSMVRSVRTPKVSVYDIQVEGNRNFFAQGILVHNCIIIDDVTKNREEAYSDTVTSALKQWYGSTLYTRRATDAVVVLVQTRWSEKDLPQHLLDTERDKWEILNLPAINDKDEALWPERFPLDVLLDIKRTIGSHDFEALYQQRPAPAEGAFLKRAWFKFYKQLPKLTEKIQSWDLAFTGKETSDFTVGQVWGTNGTDKYLIDQVRARMDFPTAIQAIRQLSYKHPDTYTKIVEEKANGAAAIATLQREISGLIPYNPKTSKEARVSAVSPELEAGNVYLPDPSIAPWIGDFIEECCSFPSGKNDDALDAMTQALIRFRESSGDRLRKLIQM